MRSPYSPYCNTVIITCQEVFLCYSIAMPDSPRLVKLARRVISASESVVRALKDQTSEITKSIEAEKQKQVVPANARAEVYLRDAIEVRKNAEDTRKDRNYRALTLGVSIATLLAVIIYAWLAYLQWNEMIGATDAAQDAVREARLNRQQSQRDLDATIDQFHLDQRPWVYVSQFQLSAEPEASKEPPKITIALSNSGKTPAINLRSVYETFSSPVDPPFKDLKTSEPIPVGVLPPGVSSLLIGTEPINSVVRTPGHLPGYNVGKNFIYIHVKITYTDMFKQTQYWTTACAYHTHGFPLNLFNFCKVGNDVGQEKQKPK